MSARTRSSAATPSGIEFLFKKNKVDWLKGHGTLRRRRTRSRSATDGTVRRAKNIVIATGSSVTAAAGRRDRREARASTSTGALELAKVPEHLRRHRRRRDRAGARLGLAAARRQGHRGRVPRPDPARHRRRGRARKRTRSSRSRASSSSWRPRSPASTRKGDDGDVTVEPAKGGAAETIEADCVLVSIGRAPYTDGARRSAARPRARQARPGRRSTTHFRTNVPGIWAIGDVIPGPMLAHKAEDEGIAVAEKIAGQTGIVNHDVDPERGLHLARDRRRRPHRRAGQGARRGTRSASSRCLANGRAKPIDEHRRLREGHRRRRRPTACSACTCIGPRRGTMIAEAAAGDGIRRDARTSPITCHAHPTLSEAIKEAAMAVTGKPIHI